MSREVSYKWTCPKCGETAQSVRHSDDGFSGGAFESARATVEEISSAHTCPTPAEQEKERIKREVNYNLTCDECGFKVRATMDDKPWDETLAAAESLAEGQMADHECKAPAAEASIRECATIPDCQLASKAVLRKTKADLAIARRAIDEALKVLCRNLSDEALVVDRILIHASKRLGGEMPINVRPDSPYHDIWTEDLPLPEGNEPYEKCHGCGITMTCMTHGKPARCEKCSLSPVAMSPQNTPENREAMGQRVVEAAQELADVESEHPPVDWRESEVEPKPAKCNCTFPICSEYNTNRETTVVDQCDCGHLRGCHKAEPVKEQPRPTADEMQVEIKGHTGNPCDPLFFKDSRPGDRPEPVKWKVGDVVEHRGVQGNVERVIMGGHRGMGEIWVRFYNDDFCGFNVFDPSLTRIPKE